MIWFFYRSEVLKVLIASLRYTATLCLDILWQWKKPQALE